MQNKSLKYFGVALSALTGLAAILTWYHDNSISLVLMICALITGVLVFTRPAVFLPMYRAWMMFAAMVGWVNTRIILFTVYIAVLTPISLILRIIGHDPLLLRKTVKTTWVERENIVMSESFRRQF